jgi:hypothetical protein
MKKKTERHQPWEQSRKYANKRVGNLGNASKDWIWWEVHNAYYRGFVNGRASERRIAKGRKK